MVEKPEHRNKLPLFGCVVNLLVPTTSVASLKDPKQYTIMLSNTSRNLMNITDQGALHVLHSVRSPQASATFQHHRQDHTKTTTQGNATSHLAAAAAVAAFE